MIVDDSSCSTLQRAARDIQVIGFAFYCKPIQCVSTVLQCENKHVDAPSTTTRTLSTHPPHALVTSCCRSAGWPRDVQRRRGQQRVVLPRVLEQFLRGARQRVLFQQRVPVDALVPPGQVLRPRTECKVSGDTRPGIGSSSGRSSQTKCDRVQCRRVSRLEASTAGISAVHCHPAGAQAADPCCWLTSPGMRRDRSCISVSRILLLGDTTACTGCSWRDDMACSPPAARVSNDMQSQTWS